MRCFSLGGSNKRPPNNRTSVQYRFLFVWVFLFVHMQPQDNCKRLLQVCETEKSRAASAAEDFKKGLFRVHTITLKILNGYRASRARAHTHPFNAVSLWRANSHASYITGLLLPGRTPLTNPCTLCCTWAIYTQHPRHGSSKNTTPVNYSLRNIPKQKAGAASRAQE